MPDLKDLHVVFQCPKELSDLPLEFAWMPTTDDRQMPLVSCFPFSKYVTDVPFRFSPPSRNFYTHRDLNVLFLACDTSGRVTVDDEDYELPEIPSVHDEIEAIRDLVDERRGEIRCHVEFAAPDLDRDAVIDIIRSRPWSIIHIAAHGVHADNHPDRSALIFRRRKSVAQAAPLAVGEIVKCLRQDSLSLFVYLSCCEGAQHGNRQALLRAPFLGIADALLQAGVPAVLGMRWPLPDESAPVLAREFYASLFRGQGIVRSLFDARAAVGAAYPHHATWASPILVCQGRE